MKSRLKRISLLTVAIVMILTTIIMDVPTRASSGSYSAKELQEIEMLYKAAKRCLGSSKSTSLMTSLSYRSDFNSQYAKDYYNLNSSKLFESGHGSGNSNMVYHELIEQMTGKHDDGKIYCSELNVLPDLMNKLGIYTRDKVDSLICNGSNPGIFNVTAGFGGQMFHNKYGDWPAGLADPDNGADCGANLALLEDYVEVRPQEAILGSGNGNHDYDFNIKMKISDNAQSYFDSFISPYLPSFEAQRDLIDYWNYYKTFNLACASITSGQTLKPADSSSNMIPIFDAESNTIYYHSKNNIHQSDAQYVYTDNDGTMTCLEIAEKLAPDESLMEDLFISQHQGAIQACVDKYNELRQKYSDYYYAIMNAALAADKFVTLETAVIDGISSKGNIKPAGSSGTGTAIEQYNKNAADYIASASVKVEGEDVFALNVFTTLKAATDDLIANSTIGSDGKVSDTTVTSTQISDVKKILKQVSDERDRVKGDLDKILKFLNDNKDYTNVDPSTLRGTVWEYDKDKGEITCPGESGLEDKFKGLGLSKTPNISATYNPGDYGKDPDPESGEMEKVDPSVEEKCYAEAKSLGWVICPIIFGLRETTEHFYEGVEPLIMTNESIVSQLGSNQSGLYEAWAVFRGFANVIFVIFFMIIIFSQLTGFGIDNYGIKRMLPKLIITALIVNLSFWLCAIAVDASNIAGKSIKVLLEGIGNRIFSDFGGSSANAVGYMGNRLVGILTGGITATIIAGVSFALNGWAIIIPILLFFLSVVIAVFFALIILGMRQALVVILIVVAPLAFVCMLLPNTEGVYKKWFSAAKGVLMVYPIAAAIIGAGYLTGSILMSADDGFIMTIVSGILMVGPYFLIPSLTRKALDAVGNLGSRIGNFGRNFGAGTRNRINNSDAVRNAKADSKAAAKRAGAGLYMKTFGKGVERDLKNGKKVSMRRANQYARNAGLATANRQSMINARTAQSQYNRLSSDTGFDAAMAAANASEFDTEVKNYESLISTGAYNTFDGNGETKIDSNDNAALQRELEHELSQTGADVSGAKIRALQNQLAKNGKEGRNAMYNAMANAQTKAGAAGLDKEAVKNFSSNILNNHAGTMKEKARSLYEFAKQTAVNGAADSGKNNITDYASAGIGSLTAADMANMDKQQLARYGSSVTEGSKEAQILGQLAQSALTDEHLSKDLSDTAYNQLCEIATKGGYTPPARRVDATSDSVKIDHTTQADAQQISSTQAANAVAEATRAAQAADANGQMISSSEQRHINETLNRMENPPQLINPSTGKPFGA